MNAGDHQPCPFLSELVQGVPSGGKLFRSNRDVGTGLQEAAIRGDQGNFEVGSCDDELRVIRRQIPRSRNLEHSIARWLDLALSKDRLSDVPSVMCLCQREHVRPHGSRKNIQELTTGSV